jgi:hypothetical protein
MLQLDFSSNWNGKLFNDTFSDIRLHNPDINFLGNEMEVMEKSIYHGIVKIVAVRSFPYYKINDVLAFINVGKPAAYQAEILKRCYAKNQAIQPDMQLDHIVFTYTKRNIETQSQLLTEWWQTKQYAN